nr:ankyrin-1-like [Quercus suber]
MDSSSSSCSFEVHASSNVNQATQTDITYMDRIFYEAAVEGMIETFKDNKEPLQHILTPNKNTVLHVHLITTEKESKSLSTNFVGEILDMCPPLLWQSNAKYETPLHIAARYGHATIVKVLIERGKSPHQELESGSNAAREMLRMTNVVKDTALHEAVRYNHHEVVKLLLAEDPDFSYSANDAGETPLYMAAERKFPNLVSEILCTCSSPAYGGPLGRTVLHAAVIWDDEGTIYLFFGPKSILSLNFYFNSQISILRFIILFI